MRGGSASRGLAALAIDGPIFNSCLGCVEFRAPD